jgi:hypothetical protein
MTGPAGGLSVLAEEDETEEEEDEDDDDQTTSDNVTAVQDTPYLQSDIEQGSLNEPATSVADEVESAPTTTPAPSRLRELQLASSASTGTPVRSPSGIAPFSAGSTGSRRAGTITGADVPDDAVPSAGAGVGVNANGPSRPSRPSPSISPTKGYGAIGRGRPRPLSGIGSSAFFASSSTASSPLTGSISTPKSASMLVSRRRAPGSGSRGSSISYKKDGDSIGSGSASSRDWGSLGSKGLGSPSLSSTSREVGSPPFSFSPKFTGWGNLPRTSGGNANRPCPRPRSLVGLGIEGRGSGRVLGEVSEAEEEASTSRIGGWPSTAPLPLAAMPFRGFNQAGMSLGGSLGEIAAGIPEDAVSGRGSSEVDRDSAESFAQWRDPNLEMMMERDSLREDVQLWRKRCKGLEERLDGERKEAGVLRDRVRKREYAASLTGSGARCERSPVHQAVGPFAHRARIELRCFCEDGRDVV